MADRAAQNARIASVAGATAIALACGTNYAFSAWGPSFAKRMDLNATQVNVIYSCGTVYATGIPSGLLIDHTHPRWAILLGGIVLACGYLPICSAYEKGPGSMSVAAISFFAFLTGYGSCCAFAAAIKVSTYNWPHKRGTANALPIAGFGLSAFFFATIGNFAFGSDIGAFLQLLGYGTCSLCLVSLPFMRMVPPNTGAGEYSAVPSDEDRPILHRGDSNKLSWTRTKGVDAPDQGSSSPRHQQSASESSSLLQAPTNPPSGQAEITGFRLLGTIAFWALFLEMGLLAGVGLMTINNIGNDAAALWLARDPNTPRAFIQSREKMHVSILSLGSFLGRLASGVSSDLLTQRLGASRSWCLVASASVLVLAQLLALGVSKPELLFLVSSLTGVGYGALFGVFPPLVADAFGVGGMALNWGFMILAPVLSSQAFNVAYGRIYDSNSEGAGGGSAGEGGNGDCHKGLACYRDAYWVTLCSSAVGVCIALWNVRVEARRRAERWAARQQGGREA